MPRYFLNPNIRQRALFALLAVGVVIGGGLQLPGTSSSVTNAFAQQATTQNDAKKAPATNAAQQFVASNWNVNCTPQSNSETLACALTKSIVVAKSRDVFVSLAIRPTPPNSLAEPYFMMVRIPHGLSFSAGVQFQIDDQTPSALPLFTSNPQGVFARIGIANELQSSLQKGNKLILSFAARNGRKFSVPISLKGFAAGFDKLK